MEKDAARSPFGTLLRRLRLAAGLSQETLSERARMSVEGISALERGVRRAPQRDTLALWVGALELHGEDRRAFEAAAILSRPHNGNVLRTHSAQERPWLVPSVMRTRYFTGREALLAQLHLQLTERHRAALCGLGGIGKTQAALEYAMRHRAEYQGGVFWINAETVTGLTGGFVEIAKALHLPAAVSSDHEHVVRATIGWLGGADRWLLILDNVEDRRQVERFVSEDGRGDVLITSRESIFAELGIARALEVHDLGSDEAVRFLLTRTGREGSESAERAAASELAAELGNLPLALEQAAVYISETSARFSAYLNAFRKRRLELLEKASALVSHESVAVTWATNFEVVKRLSPAAADALRVSAFLAPDAIPFDIF